MHLGYYPLFTAVFVPYGAVHELSVRGLLSGAWSALQRGTSRETFPSPVCDTSSG